MRKTLLILGYEIGTTIRRKSFLFAAFGLPLLGFLIFMGVTVLNRNASSDSSASSDSGSTSELKIEGYVDPGGLIAEIPDSVPAGTLVAYPDEESARRALDEGEISAYYVVAADYVESGELVYVNPGYRVTSERGQSWVMQRTLFANLLGNDAERVSRAWHPMDVEIRELDPAAASKQRGIDDASVLSAPYVVTLITAMTILMSAGFLLESVTKEKQNDLIEILLSSVTPQQMLSGKIVGLGIMGLVQTAIWMGTGFALLGLSGRTSSLPTGFDLPPSILAWGIIFFVLGYVVYASLMAALGAVVPNVKEGSQATFVVIWPALIPMMLVYYLMARPHGALAVGLSLFPLTAPFTMMTRLAAGGVPFWQPLLAACLMLGAAFLIVRAAAGVFRAQTLLSGQPFSARRFFAALLGRATPSAQGG